MGRAVASPLPLHVMSVPPAMAATVRASTPLQTNSPGASQPCSSHFLRHHSFKRDATPSYFFSTLLGGAGVGVSRAEPGGPGGAGAGEFLRDTGAPNPSLANFSLSILYFSSFFLYSNTFGGLLTEGWRAVEAPLSGRGTAERWGPRGRGTAER